MGKISGRRRMGKALEPHSGAQFELTVSLCSTMKPTGKSSKCRGDLGLNPHSLTGV